MHKGHGERGEILNSSKRVDNVLMCMCVCVCVCVCVCAGEGFTGVSEDGNEGGPREHRREATAG